jgi:NodT family efflux transporter outer membrane factor (OMF) lipoprotein
MSKAVGAALVVLVLTGCATQVPQSLPAQMVPSSFTSPADSQIWPDASWWEGFGNLELATLIRKAQADNRNIAIAAAQVLQARARSTIQRSALLPQIGGQANFLNDRCRGHSCSTFSNDANYGVSFNASYELDLWGLNRSNLRSANEQVKSARFAKEAVALSVTANVATQYLSVLAIRGRLAIANENIAAINGITDVIKLRVQAGTTSHLDLAREQAQIEDVKAQLLALQTQEKQTLFSLAVLLGEPPGGFDVNAQNLDGVLAPAIGAGLPSELLIRRPDIAQAEADLASAHADVDAARAQFFPQISLTGQGGFINTAISGLLQASNFGYSYGATLLQTIFNGGNLIGQKRLAEARQQELVASYQNTILNAYADVESALIEVANTAAAEDHLRHKIEASHEAFQISELQYRYGTADLLTVLQAQQTLFSARDQLAQVTFANRRAAVHLYQSLGGGWLENREDRTQITW